MKWKLLIYSHLFAPSVGRVETVTMALAEGLADWWQAHPQENIEVTVAAQTAAARADDSRFPFAIVHRPGLRGLARIIGKADAIHLAGPALLPLALGELLRKPTFVEHHGDQSICPDGLLMYGPGANGFAYAFLAGWLSTMPRQQNCAVFSGKPKKYFMIRVQNGTRVTPLEIARFFWRIEVSTCTCRPIGVCER